MAALIALLQLDFARAGRTSPLTATVTSVSAYLQLAAATVVLGLGTFIAIIIALVLSGSTTTDGEPSDALWMLHAAVPLLRL